MITIQVGDGLCEHTYEHRQSESGNIAVALMMSGWLASNKNSADVLENSQKHCRIHVVWFIRDGL